jgi:hypothetical protein
VSVITLAANWSSILHNRSPEPALVVNTVVLWNTWYMQDALDERGAQRQQVRPENVERLAPLRFRHINVHGKYHFTLPETVVQGHLRPLQPLSSSSEELF